MLLLDQHNGAANESRLLGSGSERHSGPGGRRAADVCVDCLIEGDEMSTAHTGLPWMVSEDRTTIRYDVSAYQWTKFGEFVASTKDEGQTPDIDAANAEFIVRACNAHDDLVKALQAARRDYIDANAIAIPEEQAGYPLLVEMDAALARATGAA